MRVYPEATYGIPPERRGHYNSLQAMQAMRRLKELETLSPPHD